MLIRRRAARLSVAAALAMGALAAGEPFFASAAMKDDIQAKIDSRTADIKALEAEIAAYQSELDALGSKESSLSGTLKSLDITQKKLQADIALTEDKIGEKGLELQTLSRKIGGAESDIADDRRSVAESFKRMAELGGRSFAETILSSGSISDALGAIEGLAAVQDGLQGRIRSLGQAKTRLETSKKATEAARADLLALEKQLTDQRAVVVSTKAEQAALLGETKSSEAAYQRLLAAKQAEKDAFEAEILRYESDLKIAVDLSALPAAGTAVLSWPLASIRVTQYFGGTAFATRHAQLYSGKGHNGVDFRASIGTPVMAALTGTVTGTGDTDAIPGCYSLGRWILVKHPNGLSTLYAHLSIQSVSPGETVTTGETIGWSGNTGYTTGPHLHFGVYASSGIEVKQFTDSLHCKNAVLPIAALAAYMNPLSYLPPLP